MIDRFVASGLSANDNRRSRLLAVLMLACLAANAAGCVASLALDPSAIGTLGFSTAIAVIGLSLWLNRAGSTNAAAHLFVACTFVTVNAIVLITGGAESSVFSTNAAIVALAAVVLGLRFSAIYTAIALLLALPHVLAPDLVAPLVLLDVPPVGALLTQTMTLIYVLIFVTAMVNMLQAALAEREAKNHDLDNALARLHQTSVSREYVTNVIAAVGDILVVTDARNVITDANPAAEKQLGVPLAALVGKPLSDILINPNLVHDGGSGPVATRIRRADGRQLPVLASRGSLPVHTGQTGGHVWAMSDTTVQEAAVEAVRRAHGSSEAANQAKSQFLANMSHELRTPLNAIIGYSELLGEDELTADQRHDLSRIRGAGHHLLGLINGILDLSKVEAGKMELELKEVELPVLITEVGSAMAPVIQRKGLRFESEMSPGLGTARVDEAKTRQIILNLLSNAAKFTETGSIRLLTETWSREGMPWLRIQVQDTGIGMNANQIEGVFEPFAQGEVGSRRRYGGTGLGLSLTRAFTRMMGGEIYVQSQPSQGATFTVEIPIGELERMQTPGGHLRRELPLAARPDETLILHIDDDPNVLELVQRIVQSPSRRVVSTSDPQEGLVWAQTLKPSAMLLDVQMPMMTGWNVLARLREDPAHCPVVILTAEGEEDVARALGAAAFLRKPIDRPRLIATLDAVVSGAHSPRLP